MVCCLKQIQGIEPTACSIPWVSFKQRKTNDREEDMMLLEMKKAYQNYDFNNLKDYRLYEGYFVVDGDNVKMIVREFSAGLKDPSPLKFFFKKGDEFQKIENNLLENFNIKMGKNTVQLTNGEYLVNWYGKYDPQMSFLVNWNTMPYFYFRKLDYNMNIEFDGEPYVMYGDYWISRKGKHCFRPLPKDRAEHMLIKVSWERGMFEITHGRNPELEKVSLYYHRARSRGGGIGNTYYILQKGYVHRLSVDDI